MAMITSQGVARLARVQRPVVSTWRRRARGSADPFPEPVRSSDGHPLFDADEVASWLVRTGRGNNPDAVLDAAAYAAPATAAASVATMSALLTLRALHGGPIGHLDVADLQRLARRADADDDLLRAEIAACDDDLPELARHIDAAVDADYSTSAALSRLLASSGEGDGPFSLSLDAMDLIEALLQSLVSDVMHATGTAPLVVVDARPTALLRLVAGSLEADLEMSVRSSRTANDLRMLRRLLTIEGRSTSDDAVADDSPAVHLIHLPSSGDTDATRAMTDIDDIALAMTDEQRALVIGPASLLVDPLDGEADRLRSNVLRLGRVRAIVRLPRGCAPTAPRAHIALWVLGASQDDTPVAARTVITADLDRLELTTDVQHDAVLDIASSLGSAYERHLRAFRFAMPVALRSLLALGRHLVPPRLRTEPFDTDAQLVSRYLEARGQVDAFAPLLAPVAPTDSAHQPLAPALLGDLVRDRLVRRFPGARIPDAALTQDDERGYPVISAVQVRGEVATHQYVDRMRLAQLSKGVRLTEPGDVIVVAGGRPAAMLDVFGASIVQAPAAILRVDRAASVPIEPALLQHDIERFAEGEWRTWPVRRLAVSAHETLRESMAEVAGHVAELAAHIERLKDYERALVDGFVAGVLASGAEHARKDARQGGH